MSYINYYKIGVFTPIFQTSLLNHWKPYGVAMLFLRKVKEDWLNWVLYKKRESDHPLGTIQASAHPNENADIAFIIFPEYWGKGYGRKASQMVINYIFPKYTLKSIDTRNHRSIRMVESIGLQRVREIKNADHFKGQSSDEYEYELSFDQWRANLHISGKTEFV